ncbi:hypothetical protein BAE44_0018531 [Dichanthelium oligosanthes]|uniref:Uncharacterized protein n=1 Tax=Dichanthelium oligosanthes TaxID=888268 RepID=A0A1E5V5L3_9POAL|nr:hypothetical protein BAE44_0018531 [Dichanthelium oligosanthes]
MVHIALGRCVAQIGEWTS